MASIRGTIVEVPGTQRPADLAQTIAVIGHFAGIPQGEVRTVQRSGEVKSIAGYGKGSDLAMSMLRGAEAFDADATLYLVPTPATVAGSITFDGQTGFGPAATLAASDADPHDDATVSVRIAKGGAPGIATFELATAFSVVRNPQGGTPTVSLRYDAPRVMPPRTKAALVGNVDLATISYALPATVIGSVDLVNATALYGASGTLAGKEFDITLDANPLATVTFGTGANAPTSYSAVIAQIDAAISGTGTVSVNGLGQLVITGLVVSTTGTIVLAAGTPDALAVLGLAAGTTNGTAGALDGLTILYEGDATSGAQTFTAPTGATAYASADELVLAFNALTGVDAEAYTARRFLRIGSATAGSASTFEINGGTALSTLGLIAGSATGAESEFVIEHLGVKITFAAGTYSAGYTRTWSVKAPACVAADIIDAVDLLVGNELYFGRVVVASEPTIADLPATIQACEAKALALSVLNDPRTVNFVLMAPDEGDDLVYAAFTSAPTKWVTLAARHGVYQRPGVSSIDGGGALVRSSGWPLAGLFAAYALGSDIGQHSTNGTPAPLSRLLVDYVSELEDGAAVKMALLRDQTALPRACVIQKFADGYRFCGGFTLALPASIYADQYAFDVALRVFQLTHAALLPWLNDPTLPTTPDGKLTDEGAAAVAASVVSILLPLLPKDDEENGRRTSLIQRLRVSVDQTEIIAGINGSQRLKVSVTFEINGIARAISFTVGAGHVVEG